MKVLGSIVLVALVVLAVGQPILAAEAADNEATGEQLVRKLWKHLEEGDIPALKEMMAPGFQSVHPDGARDGKQEIELIRGLSLGSCKLSDIKVTQNGSVLVATYFVSVQETIDGKVLSNAPAARMTVFLMTDTGWKWIGHANLKPLG